MPALPTSIGPAGIAEPAQPGAADHDLVVAALHQRAQRARPRPASRACRRRRGSRAPAPARRPSRRAARRGARSTCRRAASARPAAARLGSKRTFSLRTGMPSPADQLRARPAPRPRRPTARPRRSCCPARAERHVGDVDARAAERQRDLGDDAGPVGDGGAQLAHRRRPRARPRAARGGCRRPRSARPAAPRRRRARARRAPRRARRCWPRWRRAARRGWRGRSRSRARGLAPATRVASRKLGPGRRQPVAAQRAGGLRDEDVGQHVRQVRDGGHQCGRGRRGRRPRAARRGR